MLHDGNDDVEMRVNKVRNLVMQSEAGTPSEESLKWSPRVGHRVGLPKLLAGTYQASVFIRKHAFAGLRV